MLLYFECFSHRHVVSSHSGHFKFQISDASIITVVNCCNCLKDDIKFSFYFTQLHRLKGADYPNIAKGLNVIFRDLQYIMIAIMNITLTHI